MKQGKDTTYIGLTLKGELLISAMRSGLLPKTEGGWPKEPFERFWNDFSNTSKTLKMYEDLDHVPGGSGKGFDQHSEKESQNRNYDRPYRNLVAGAVISFFAGMVLVAFLKAFGFGICLLGLLLLFFGVMIPLCFQD